MAPSIIVKDISKRYQIGTKLISLRDLFTVGRDSQKRKYHWAARDISFELHPGEALGIIGPNGAGKTTILKILSKVTRPTSGEVIVNGRFSALIELGAGFHPDLTGRDNIYLNGTILGMSKFEIKNRFDDIVDFAGIGQFLDTPVKRYSSGMFARLGFAIAAHVDPQVLLVDEVLAVGDYAFQMKCHARLDKLRRENGTTLVFVSHNLEAVRRVCERGLVMYRGEAIYQGSAAEAIVAYSDALREAARTAQLEVPLEEGLSQRVMTFDAEIEKVSLLDIEGRPVTGLESGAHAVFAVDVLFHKDVQQPDLSFTIRTPDGRVVYDTMTSWMKIKIPDFTAGERCRIEYKLIMPLLDGRYELDVTIMPNDLSHFYDYVEGALAFTITGTTWAKGLVDLDAQIAVHRPEMETRNNLTDY